MANETISKNKGYSGGEDEEEVQGVTQFEPHESDNSETMWDVIRILRESKTKYQVEWAGDDPATGKPWKPTWIPKEDCTDELIQDWKAQKRGAKEAKKLERRSSQRQQSVASSSKTGTRSSLTVSHRDSEEPTVSRRPFPVVEIIRKRRRSPSIVEQPPATTSSAADSESDPQEKPKLTKRRRLVESSRPNEEIPASPYIPVSDISPPAAKQRSVGRPPSRSVPSPSKRAQSQESRDTIIPDSYEMPYDNSSEQEIEQSLSQPPAKQRASPQLRPVPQISPTVFRGRMEPPLSQIEQFSSPGASPVQSKNSPANIMDATEELQPELELKNAYELIVSHRAREGDYAGSQSSARTSSISSRHSGLMDALPFPESSVASLRRDLAKKPIHAEEANEAYIAGLEARISALEAERGVLEQTLETASRNHVAAKRTLEKDVSRLMEALGRIRTAPIPAIVAPSHAETQLVEAIVAAPPPYVRSAEDDAIITQLREEAAKLQDVNAQLRAEKTQSNTMVEQVRDVARRAEVARMELARKEKIARETAQNAPKIAAALYMDSISKLEAEVQKFKVQNELLLEQNRLTGDVTRQRAAKTAVLQRKYQKLAAKHEQMFDDMVDAENEREEALQYMQTVKEVVTQMVHGPPGTSMFTQLAKLLQTGPQEIPEDQRGGDEDDQDQDGEGEEMEEDDEEPDEDSAMETGFEYPHSRPIVEEKAQSYDGPDLRDPPTILIEIGEGPIGRTFVTPRSTQSEKSDGLAFLCLWHQTEETCQEYRTTKEALRDHIFEDHLEHL